MEMKTIRFEKDSLVTGTYLSALQVLHHRYFTRYDITSKGEIFVCLKSFTVTITITEDGE